MLGSALLSVTKIAVTTAKNRSGFLTMRLANFIYHHGKWITERAPAVDGGEKERTHAKFAGYFITGYA